MDPSAIPHDDLVRLNAFVDGELAPAERAAVAARLAADRNFASAHATLARLKACVDATIEDAPVQFRPLHRPPRQCRRWLPAGGLAAAAACIALLATRGHAPHHLSETAAATPDVALAGASWRPALPHLDIAGLTLVAVTAQTGAGSPVVTAGYLGPHGCKLELYARPAGSEPAIAANNHRAWTVDAITYELVAHGMPDRRFASIADAAERLTRRDDRLPASLERRLREARAAAPCAG
jgi:hypothetical protein